MIGNIHLYVKAEGMIVEINRTKMGPGWRSYKVTPSSWRRILYLAKKVSAHFYIYEIRFLGQDSSAAHSHAITLAF